MVNEQRQNGRPQIVWLDDKPRDIERLIQAVQARADFDISVVEQGTKALTMIAADPPPEMFVVDLLLHPGADDGLRLAKTARQMRPLIPVVAVTEHLPEFHSLIVSSLVTGNYPFDAVWEKDELQSKEAIDGFVDSLGSLCMVERHVGTVVRVESDYTQIRARTPRGDEYERFFESPFLAECGIDMAGQQVELVFRKTTHGTWGEVCMQLEGYSVEEGDLDEEIKAIMAKVDLEKIREKFGSVMD